MSMKWKVLKEIENGSKKIPKGSILSQIKALDIEASVRGTISALNRMHPYKKLVVCDFNNQQHVFEVGKDVIPYGRGIR